MAKLLSGIKKIEEKFSTVYNDEDGTLAALQDIDTEYTKGFNAGHQAGYDCEDLPAKLTESEYDIGFYNGYLKGKEELEKEFNSILRFYSC